MSEQCILREDKNGVCYLRLNRPEKLNALDSVLFSALDKELEELETREDIHVIVLSGAGKAFCAGHDVNVLGKEGQDENLNARVVSRLADTFFLVRFYVFSLSVPCRHAEALVKRAVGMGTHILWKGVYLTLCSSTHRNFANF